MLINIRLRLLRSNISRDGLIDVTYGERTGRNLNGSGRADFFSAMLMVDIPLFTNKRQDKRLTASQKKTPCL